MNEGHPSAVRRPRGVSRPELIRGQTPQPAPMGAHCAPEHERDRAHAPRTREAGGVASGR